MNLLLATLLAPRILRSRLDFWKSLETPNYESEISGGVVFEACLFV
jgi:hypothetical protein